MIEAMRRNPDEYAVESAEQERARVDRRRRALDEHLESLLEPTLTELKPAGATERDLLEEQLESATDARKRAGEERQAAKLRANEEAHTEAVEKYIAAGAEVRRLKAELAVLAKKK